MCGIGVNVDGMTTKTRRSVPLEPADIARIDRISGDMEALLARHVGKDVITSEAALMHALVLCGLETIEHEADEERYRALAASQDDDDRAFHDAVRARQRHA